MKKIIAGISAVALCLLMSVGINAESKNNENKYIVDLDDGGKDYVQIENDVEIHSLVPPSGFNPIEATDEELAQYCFPPRPEDEEELSQWISNMECYNTTPIPEIKYSEGKAPKKKAMEYANYVSTDDQFDFASTAGYRAFTSCYAEVSQVQMNYIQPTVSAISGFCYNRYGIGIGGSTNETRLSAGTCTYGKTTHNAWIQWRSEVVNWTSTPMHLISVDSLHINAGDSIHLYIAYEKENNKFSYYIANNTTGEAHSGYNILSSATYYDGLLAHWFVERVHDLDVSNINPNINNTDYFNLGNFGTFTASMCQYKLLNTSSWINLSNATSLQKNVMKNNGRVLCEPGSVFGGSCFTCTWQAYN